MLREYEQGEFVGEVASIMKQKETQVFFDRCLPLSPLLTMCQDHPTFYSINPKGHKKIQLQSDPSFHSHFKVNINVRDSQPFIRFPEEVKFYQDKIAELQLKS